MKKRSKLIVLLLAAVMLLTFMPVLAYAEDDAVGSDGVVTNKALNAKMSFTGTFPDTFFNNFYSMEVQPKSKLNMNKSMKVSMTIYVPKDMLKDKGSNVEFAPYVSYGSRSVMSKYYVTLKNKSGKVKIIVSNEKGKTVKTGSKAKLSETEKFYVLKINNIALKAKNDKGKAIPTGKKAVTIKVHIIGRECGYTGKLYLDDVKLKAKKTTKISFDTKDYKKAYVFSDAKGKTIKSSVSKIPE